MSNHLEGQSSPYLLQHVENPVDWYPWGKEAFERAVNEDKPIFLSIGYSTCHWCHVMAHESFEDNEIAKLLNQHFISIKIDKEERPDLDSIYMAVCQAFTGSSGWPTSIFMTSDRKPFYAGTYFPKEARYGSIGLKELLLTVIEKWEKERESLLQVSDSVIHAINHPKQVSDQVDENLVTRAIKQYKESFDEQYGGFSSAPKFPTPHNLIFLMRQYQKHGDKRLLEMAEKTLLQMYRGGLFDHIGGGFSRYSTDQYFLVPHFEKMLYDNALLILSYCEAYELTGNTLYRNIAEKTVHYVMKELRSPEGGFYCAQDADSEGEEGKYYVFTVNEIKEVIGEKEGTAFCQYYDITKHGNFEGKSIPNLLHTDKLTDQFETFLPKINEYRKNRTTLHRDDKILTFWNSLMIAALCSLYRVTQNKAYLQVAEDTKTFIDGNLYQDGTLYVSWRKNKLSGKGFLDDYAGYIFALLALYEVTFDHKYIDLAMQMKEKVIEEYFDTKQGGFFLSGSGNEELIARPKESYDGAIPSGNSLMTYNLVRLNYMNPDTKIQDFLQRQLCFMSGEANQYPVSYAMFLIALSDYLEPPTMITVVQGKDEQLSRLPFQVPTGAIVKVLSNPCDGYELLNDKTTFYVCKNHTCQPPTNEINFS